MTHHHHTSTGSETYEPLKEGDGHGQILFFDCFSGVAGDMTLAALIDLGVPVSVFEEAVAALPIDGYELCVKQTEKHGIAATAVDVLVEGKQPHRTYGAIDDMLVSAALDEATKRRARAIFLRLGEAEARTHRVPLRDVHFHEVGAVDAIVDIVGAAAGLGFLGASVCCSPLPMGRGFVTAQHGILPLPAPATVACLIGVPTYGVELDVELVTPTGAAIVKSSAERFMRWPEILPERVGFGAGTINMPDRPNLLRLVLGKAHRSESEARHTLVQANVDDLTGELGAFAIRALLEAGALDAWISPIIMKKGRPGLLIEAIAAHAHTDKITDTMLRETSTIGVRKTPVWRVERPREIVKVHTRFGQLPIKVCSGDHHAPQAKPEFDACADAAIRHQVPVRMVLVEALNAYARLNDS